MCLALFRSIPLLVRILHFNYLLPHVTLCSFLPWTSFTRKKARSVWIDQMHFQRSNSCFNLVNARNKTFLLETESSRLEDVVENNFLLMVGCRFYIS